MAAHFNGFKWRDMQRATQLRDYVTLDQVIEVVAEQTGTWAEWEVKRLASSLNYTPLTDEFDQLAPGDALLANNGAGADVIFDSLNNIKMTVTAGNWSTATSFSVIGKTKTGGSLTFTANQGALPARQWIRVDDATNSGPLAAGFPLTIFCINLNKFGVVAFDPAFPTDYVEYDFNLNTRGTITYREDTTDNISAYENWRGAAPAITIGTGNTNLSFGKNTTGIIGNNNSDIICGNNCNIEIGNFCSVISLDKGSTFIATSVDNNSIISIGKNSSVNISLDSSQFVINDNSSIAAQSIQSVQLPNLSVFNDVNFDLLGVNTNGSVISLTYAEAQTLVAGNNLIPDVLYFISDKADVGIRLMSASNSLFYLEGEGGFNNPDFQMTGDYTNVGSYTLYNGTDANGGVWSIAKESILLNGNVIIWNSSHYVVGSTGAFNGTDPATNTMAYTILPNNTLFKYGYINEWDFIQFDFTGGNIETREDRRLNKNRSFDWPLFQWGNDNVSENTVDQNSTMDCQNNIGTIKYNSVTEFSSFSLHLNSGTVNYNTITNGGGVDCSNNEGTIQSNYIKTTNVTANLNSGSTLTQCTFIDIGGVIDPASNISGKIADSRGSNFECTIDITGLTALDITAPNNYCGIVNLTSGNATETIDRILNHPLVPLMIMCATGLDVTFNIEPISTSATADILGNNSSFMVIGSSGESITIEKWKVNNDRSIVISNVTGTII